MVVAAGTLGFTLGLGCVWTRGLGFLVNLTMQNTRRPTKAAPAMAMLVMSPEERDFLELY